MKVKATELEPGDRLRHRGAMYEVVENNSTRFSNREIVARRLSLDSFTLDYKDEIEVQRDTPRQTGAGDESNGTEAQ